jgi:ATP-dependent DNA helicase RecG
MKFHFKEMQGGFLTELSYDVQKTSRDKSSDKILLLLLEDPQITISELSQKLNISTRAIEKNLSNLKATNKIRRIGSKKSGYWEIIN